MQTALLANMTQAELDWHFSDRGPFPITSNTRTLFRTEQIDPEAFGIILEDPNEYPWLVDQLGEDSQDLAVINRFWEFLGQTNPENDHPLPITPDPLQIFAWENPLPEPPELIRSRAYRLGINEEGLDEIRVFLDDIFGQEIVQMWNHAA